MHPESNLKPVEPGTPYKMTRMEALHSHWLRDMGKGKFMLRVNSLDEPRIVVAEVKSIGLPLFYDGHFIVEIKGLRYPLHIGEQQAVSYEYKRK